jgi:D-alanyl-D-alanine carboxypeptidase
VVQQRLLRPLGMSDTNFANPHGLHDARQYTTAHDLAVLIEALIREFPEHRPVFAVQQAEAVGVGEIDQRLSRRERALHPPQVPQLERNGLQGFLEFCFHQPSSTS